MRHSLYTRNHEVPRGCPPRARAQPSRQARPRVGLVRRVCPALTSRVAEASLQLSFDRRVAGYAGVGAACCAAALALVLGAGGGFRARLAFARLLLLRAPGVVIIVVLV